MKTMCPPRYHHNGFVATDLWCHRGVEVSSTNNFLAIAIIFQWFYQMCQKTPQNAKKSRSGELMVLCAASLVWGTHWKSTFGTFSLCQDWNQR